MANALGNSDATFVLSSGARRFRHLSASCRQRTGSVLAVCNRWGVWEHTHCSPVCIGRSFCGPAIWRSSRQAGRRRAEGSHLNAVVREMIAKVSHECRWRTRRPPPVAAGCSVMKPVLARDGGPLQRAVEWTHVSRPVVPGQRTARPGRSTVVSCSHARAARRGMTLTAPGWTAPQMARQDTDRRRTPRPQVLTLPVRATSPLFQSRQEPPARDSSSRHCRILAKEFSLLHSLLHHEPSDLEQRQLGIYQQP